MIQLFLLIVALAIATIIFASRLGKVWLLGAIVANLIFANIAGTHFFTFFGMDVNIGNIFYVCAFFATQVFLEQEVSQKNWFMPLKIGSFFLFFFLVFSHALSIFSAFEGGVTTSLLTETFEKSARVTAASLLAFLFAQHGHIRLYTLLREKWNGKYVMLRSVFANGAAQFVDSCIFFTVAFSDISASQLLKAIVVGWMMKTFIGAVASPFLYAFKKK